MKPGQLSAEDIELTPLQLSSEILAERQGETDASNYEKAISYTAAKLVSWMVQEGLVARDKAYPLEKFLECLEIIGNSHEGWENLGDIHVCGLMKMLEDVTIELPIDEIPAELISATLDEDSEEPGLSYVDNGYVNAEELINKSVEEILLQVNEEIMYAFGRVAMMMNETEERSETPTSALVNLLDELSGGTSEDLEADSALWEGEAEPADHILQVDFGNATDQTIE